VKGFLKIALGTAAGILLAGTIAVVALVVFFGIALSGDEKTTTTDASQRVVPVQDPAPEEPAATPAHKPPKAEKRTKPRLVACDSNIRVRSSTTTCAFAQNVFLSYWMNEDDPGVFADSPGLPAYSPASHTTFDVQCSGVASIACNAGDGAYVTFPRTAVAAYTREDAIRYAESHETGGVVPDADDGGSSAEHRATPAPDELSDPESMQEQAAGDLDCPDFAETDFAPTPGDPHGLDADGDGVACES
jgi:hypothetical protein